MDNAANMLSAFKYITGMVGPAESVPESDTEIDNAVEVEGDGEESESDASSVAGDQIYELDLTDDSEEMTECDTDSAEQILDYIGNMSKKRLPCCIHTLQLVVLDGLKTSKFMGGVQGKVSRLTTVLHTSGTFEQKFFSVFKTTIPKTTNTRWNSVYLQLSAVCKLDVTQLNKLLTEMKNETCILTKREIDIVHEVVQVLEPAYNATLIMEEEAALLSLIAPTVLQLHRTWSRMACTVKLSSSLVTALIASLERRFIGMLINLGVLPPQRNDNDEIADTANLNFGDPAYLVAAALDPEFRLNWLGDNDSLKTSVTGKTVRGKFSFLCSFELMSDSLYLPVSIILLQENHFYLFTSVAFSIGSTQYT
jgi:hypothetical protein